MASWPTKSFIPDRSSCPFFTACCARCTTSLQCCTSTCDITFSIFSQLMAKSSGQSSVMVSLRLNSLKRLGLWVLLAECTAFSRSFFLISGQFNKIQQLQLPQMLEIQEKDCSLGRLSSCSSKLVEMSTIVMTPVFSAFLRCLMTSCWKSLPFLEQKWISFSKKVVKISIIEEFMSSYFRCLCWLKWKIISFQHSQKADIFSLPSRHSATGLTPEFLSLASVMMLRPLRMSPLVQLAKLRKVLLQTRFLNLAIWSILR